MSRRTAFLLSGALTALVLVLGLAVTWRLAGAARQPVDARAEPSTISSGPAADASTATEQVARQRLEEANAALQHAYDRIGALESANSELRDVTESADRPPAIAAFTLPASSSVPLSRDQAAGLAVQAIGGGRVSSIKLEREHGRSIYEVRIGRTEVEIDATTGELFVEHDNDEDDHD